MEALQVLTAERTFTDGRSKTTFRMVSNRQPTKDEVFYQQNRLGYSPFGYGGPYYVKSTKQADGSYATVWECAGSCD